MRNGEQQKQENGARRRPASSDLLCLECDWVDISWTQPISLVRVSLHCFGGFLEQAPKPRRLAVHPCLSPFAALSFLLELLLLRHLLCPSTLGAAGVRRHALPSSPASNVEPSVEGLVLPPLRPSRCTPLRTVCCEKWCVELVIQSSSSPLPLSIFPSAWAVELRRPPLHHATDRCSGLHSRHRPFYRQRTFRRYEVAVIIPSCSAVERGSGVRRRERISKTTRKTERKGGGQLTRRCTIV